MNRLRSARAYRPVKARVTAVRVKRASVKSGAVNQTCSRLVGEQECGAELPCDRARLKHTVEIGRGGEAAGGDGGYVAQAGNCEQIL